MQITISISISPRIPEPFRGTATILAWLAACEAAPPWKPPGRPAEPGTPALWVRLARVAFDGGWPRDGIEENEHAIRIVEHAAALARAAGAPAQPAVKYEGVLTYRTTAGTSLAASLWAAEVEIEGEPASVLRRALAAQTAADVLLEQIGEPEPEPEPDEEDVRHYEPAWYEDPF